MLLGAAFTASAQSPFWSEDFGNGLPSSWNTTDGSGQNILWTWCSNPEAGNSEPGCSPIWNSSTNGQTPFAATSSSNGYMTLDSDQAEQLPTDHISRLTSAPVNCTDKPVVYIKFQSHLGTYTYDADDKAILKVSTDQNTWTTFPIFDGLTTTVRWSANPHIAIIDVSSIAANQSAVYFQWEWTGNYEYMWDLDDVEVYGENPTPDNDLSVGTIFYGPSSYAAPASEIQTDTIGFEALISNNGLRAQHNVKLTAEVLKSDGTVLFTDFTQIDELPSGYKDSLLVISGRYAPEVTEGTYTIRYTVASDSTDARPVNNVRSTTFVATSNYFAKEDAPEQFYRPSSGPSSWYVCNYYKMSDSGLENYKATSLEFAHTTDDAELAITDVVAGLYLLRVKDEITDDFANLDETDFFASFDWIGIGEYAADASTVDDGGIRSVNIQDFDSGEEGVALEQGGRYFAAIGYSDANSKVYHAYNDDNEYFFTSTLQYYGGAFSTFGSEVNAVLRMSLSLTSTTDDRPLPETAMTVFPNPVKDVVNLQVALDQPQAVAVTIADLSGRVIVSDERNEVGRQQLSYTLPQLAAGTYLARIATKEGTLTRKFTVVE